MSTPRILTIMGSGETAPTMVTTHRMLAARLPKGAQAVLLDTPYGFQENAGELSTKAREYFSTSVNMQLSPANLVRITGADPVQVERSMQMIADAQYVFAGPGSPTYALRQWSGTAIDDVLRAKLRTGGIVTFASAAALTLGRRTLPVYEIYKVGEDPRWLEGLNVLSELDIDAVVVPHYNNAEGGHHDTRFCYMGERRLSQLESELEDGTWVLGVDEHTALVIDIDADVAEVTGKGVVTIRVNGSSEEIPSGERLALDRLRDPRSGIALKRVVKPPAAAAEPVGALDDTLRAATDRLSAEFHRAIDERDAEGAARAALGLEESLRLWFADTLQSDDADYARSALRGMITRLADLAVTGLRDPRESIAPVMEVLIDLRTRVRADKRFDLSDVLRDRLAELGIEVRDIPDGATWNLRA
jgi:hypothetical protein